jgi:hypothetical protein
MRPWGTNSLASRACAVLLTAALGLSACATNQAETSPQLLEPNAAPAKSVATQSEKDRSGPGNKRVAAQNEKDRSGPRNKRVAARGDKGRSGPGKATKGGIDQEHIRALAAKAAPDNPAEQERLYREFMEWSKSRQKR